MPFPALAVGMGLLGIGSQLFGQEKQKDHNMALARFQADANERYLDKQLEYNTPANQMKRFQDAGLNPHLVYGQGNPGNQSAPLTYPDIKPADRQNLLAALPLINQTAMTDAQVSNVNMSTIQKGVLADLQRQQTALIKRNPLFSDSYLTSMIDSFKSMASIKSSESQVKQAQADWFTGESSWYDEKTGSTWHGPAGAAKMEKELQLLFQKYELGAKDMALKKAVLDSKEFQNDILEIQRKWMVDGEITPQLIYQFLSSFMLRLTPSN